MPGWKPGWPHTGGRSFIVSSVNDVVDSRQAGTVGLAGELMGAISAVRRTARRAARAAWREEPLPSAQSELLRLAAARPGISVAEAARELRLAPNTVSTLVGRLTAAGLLGRARAESDGRSVLLTVSAKATRRIAEWRDLRAELAARALDRLTPDDRRTLAEAVPALLRFAAQLEEEHA
jgi:DNA-binding MarR family transcriptional regulator